MAAIVVEGELDLAALHAHVHKLLPDYACPLFLRIRAEIEVTMTFKQKKLNLAAQGFDPAATDDPIYFDDPRRREFVRMDSAIHRDIVDGRIRL
jgi:fatty-acyl-CoA synthase